MGLVGKKAPDFKASAVINGQDIVEEFTLKQFQGRYVVFFFYPLDFTFVCPTELHAFQEQIEAFESRNTQVVGCSVDSKYTHAAWLRTPPDKGGIQGVTYPLVSDITKTIARDFDVLAEDDGIAYRGVFLLDKKGIIRHQLVNDLSLGRNVDDVIRVIDALQFHETNGDVCPANWQKGQKSLSASTEGVQTYFQGVKVMAKS
jgi:peroxiredoxin (alkyl hydroperoxide reductase subunit C)